MHETPAKESASVVQNKTRRGVTSVTDTTSIVSVINVASSSASPISLKLCGSWRRDRLCKTHTAILKYSSGEVASLGGFPLTSCVKRPRWVS